MSESTWQLRLYISATIATGIILLGYHIYSRPQLPLASLGFFIVLALAAESLPIALPKGGLVSVGFAIWAAAVLLFGPTGGAYVALSATFSLAAILKRDRTIKFIFNAAQYVISATAAGFVLIALRGATLVESNSLRLPIDFVYFGAAATTFYLINSTMPTLAISLTNNLAFRRIWLVNVLPFIPNFAAMIALGMTMAILYAKTSYFGLILLIVPLMVARQTFHLFTQLKESHINTIKSLIASIEAKDTYTRGHSERVARIALLIGLKMGLSEKMLEKLEYSALLHDIGKIGIPQNILLKPSKLNDLEYLEVKNHPVLGAMIVEEIDFLSDIVPIVFHHHERHDGAGYVDGLSGRHIPLLAKILAVADSYDAMTSERAYRPPFSEAIAMNEIALNAGTQFDGTVVDAFLEAFRTDEAAFREDGSR